LLAMLSEQSPQGVGQESNKGPQCSVSYATSTQDK
jgi:hypothetical protein